MIETKKAKFDRILGSVNGFVGLEKDQAIFPKRKLFENRMVIFKKCLNEYFLYFLNICQVQSPFGQLVCFKWRIMSIAGYKTSLHVMAEGQEDITFWKKHPFFVDNIG